MSGSEVGKGDGSEDGGDFSVLAVKVGWGVCRFISSLISMLESKVENEFLTLIYRFVVQPGSRLHLPVEVSAKSDWGFGGEDGLLPLGCRRACHSSQSTLSSPLTVVATSGGVGTCERFRSQSYQQYPHK